jgi:uncharacterized membrane protein HdeD (DUF308 family)
MPKANGWRAWMLARGMVMVLAGGVFLMAPGLASVAAGLAVGATLVIVGAAVALSSVAVHEPGWGWAAARGVAGAAIGLLFIADPGAAVVGLTLALSAYFAFVGVLRTGVAWAWRPARGWGWMLASGVLAMLLAAVVAVGWPLDSFYVVGTLLGVEALFDGIAHVTLGIMSDARILPPRELPRVQR